MSDEETPLKLSEVAEKLGVSLKTVRRLIQSGVLQTTRYGRAVRVLPEVLQEFRRQGTCEAISESEASAPRRSVFGRALELFGPKPSEKEGGASSSKTRSSRKSS